MASIKAQTSHKKVAGHHQGHEAEPTQPHGPRVGGKMPTLHSHSARPKHARKLMRGK
jgi:hypothetical protein